MSDDVNKSNKPPMNGGFGMKDIEDIGRSAYQVPFSERALRQRAGTARTQLNSLSALPEDMLADPTLIYGKKLSSAAETVSKLEPRIQSSVRTRLERHTSQIVNAIGRSYSEGHITTRTKSMYESMDVQNASMAMNTRGYSSLSEEAQNVRSQIGALGQSSQAKAANLLTNRGPRSDVMQGISGNAEQSEALVKQLATLELAMRNKKQMGQDPLGSLQRLNTIGASASDFLDKKSLRAEIAGGKVQIAGADGEKQFIKNTDIHKELTNQAEKLKKAFEELANSAGKSSEELQELRKNAETAASNYQKLEKADAGSNEKRESAMKYLGGIGSGLSAVGGAAHQIMISQRMGEVNNVSGFANLANQQYSMYKKARAGDIASQLALGDLQKSDDFGIEMKRATNVVQGVNVAVGTTQTVAGGLEVAEGIKNSATLGFGNNGVANNLVSGANNIAQGVSTVAVNTSDMARGVSAQQNRLAGIQAQMQARQAVRAVGAEQAQGLRDFYTGLDVVGQSMGGRANAFLNEATSGANLDKMINSRMSPEQFAQAAQIGASEMGSTFNTDQIFAARNLESRGFGNTNQNMQRMATLASAGANNPKENMEAVLSAAVSKGLDSSKAIDMMVSNTAAMVSSSAGAAVGIDTTAAASSLLASSMNPEMKNKEFALQQAMTAQEMTKQATTNRDVSFTGMANTAGLRQALGKAGIKIGGDEAIIAQGVDIATLKTFKSNKEASDFFKNKGVNISEKDAGAFLQTTLAEKERQILRPGGFAVNADLEGLRKRIKSGDLTLEDNLQLGKIAEFSGRKGGGSEIIREITGVGTPNVSPGAGKNLTENVGDDLKSQFDALRTSGFKQLSEAAKSASDDLQKFGGALKVFTDLQQKFEKGGVKNEDDYRDAGAKMAKDFSAVAVNFGKATTKYEEASQATIAAIKQLSSNRNPVKPQFVSDALNQKKGSASRGTD